VVARVREEATEVLGVVKPHDVVEAHDERVAVDGLRLVRGVGPPCAETSEPIGIQRPRRHDAVGPRHDSHPRAPVAIVGTERIELSGHTVKEGTVVEAVTVVPQVPLVHQARGRGSAAPCCLGGRPA